MEALRGEEGDGQEKVGDYMATREAKIKFTAETGEFNAQIKSANSTLSLLRSELKKNATEMKGAGDSAELLTKRHEILAQESRANGEKISALNDKLDKAKQIFGENSDEVKKLQVQLNNAQNAEAKVQQEISKVNNELKAQESASRQANSALGKLESAISSQKAELSQLKNEYKSVVLEQGETSSEAQQLASKISSLNSDLNRNEQKLKEAENAADKLGNAFEEAGKDAADSADGYTIAKDVVADFVTDAVQWGIDKLKELGVEGEQALNKLQVNTGASAETMKKYKNVMEEVYAGNYGESFDDVSNAMSTVVQVMGDMDDSKLKTVTQNAMTLSNMFDMDVKESVRAANSMMDQFGISGDEAFNLIVQGAQNGLNQNDDLLDTLNEYSTQFAAAGYSADDMFNMLKNGAEDGTWSIDKLGDAVKEYNIRMTDGTANDALKELGLNAKKVTAEYAKGGDSAKKATSKVIKALQDVKDPQERYTLGQQIMGTMWEDLGEDAVYALMDTKGAIDSVNDAMAQADATTYDDVGNKVESLGRRFETDIVGPIKDAVMPALGGIVDFFSANFTWIAPIITGVAVAFGVLGTAMAIQGIIAGVSKAFMLLNGVMAMNPVVLIVAAIAGLVTAFVLLWNNCESFRNFWLGLWDGICSAFKGVGKVISGVIKDIKNWLKFSGVGSTVKGVFNGVKNFINNPIKTAQSLVKSGVSKVKGFLKFTGVGNTVMGVFNKVKSFIQNPVKTAQSFISNAVSKVKSLMKFSGVTGAVSGVFGKVKSLISNPMQSAKNAVSNIAKKIKGVFSGLHLSIPKFKIPHIKVDGGKAPWGIGGAGKAPSFSVQWYAKGGILTKPTIFGAYGNTLLGGGEAGAEAVLPISRLQGFIDNAFQNNLTSTTNTSVYNVYINDAKINDDAQIKAATKDYLVTLARQGAM